MRTAKVIFPNYSYLIGEGCYERKFDFISESGTGTD